MTSEEYRAAAMDIVYLASRAVKGQAPDAERFAGMDIELLYKIANRHLLL